MSGCGCTNQPCGCCEGMAQLTPAAVRNRPGLDALAYRVGSHAQFFETMQGRLSTIRITGVGPDGQTVQTWRPLEGLTTRDRGDLSIALLDGWATVADVLTFYQERIANEGFLRTATERRSVLELARLVGYALRPGVAATVYLAYTLDDKQTESTTIAAGARSQSVPAPGESPQSFETSEDLVARAAWNNLQVRLHRPQRILLDAALPIDGTDLTVERAVSALRTQGHVLAVDAITVAGTATNLRPGDKLLLVFNDPDRSSVVRSVASIDTQITDQRTAIALQPIDRTVVACAALLATTAAEWRSLSVSGIQDAIGAAMQIVQEVRLGLPTPPRRRVSPGGAASGAFKLGAFKPAALDVDGGAHAAASIDDPRDWIVRIRHAVDVENQALVARIDALSIEIDRLVLSAGGSAAPGTSPAAFIEKLLIPAVPQAASSANLPRSLAAAFGVQDLASRRDVERRMSADGPSSLAPQADASPQLLVRFAPALRDSLYRAWSGATVNTTSPTIEAVYALRARASLFGAGASRTPTYFTEDVKDQHVKGQLQPPDKWTELNYAPDETGHNAFLDQANEAITPGSYALIHVGELPPSTPSSSPTPPTRRVLRVAEASVAPRSEYGLTGPSTMLVFEGDASWRTTQQLDITTLRRTQVYAQSESLALVDEPITDPVAGPEIELGALYSELTSGRWVILSGERADIPGVSGVQTAELMMISGLRHGFDPLRAGDQTHTTLILATPPAYQYKRDTLTIHGNVVRATHGETRNEILGSGSGAQPLQSFTLKQPPLTFVAAPIAAGAQSTLHVYVDNVEWHEVDSLAGLGPTDRSFVTATDDAGTTQVTFGDGVHGARLPTGVQNVNAVYRSGIGAAGNVRDQQVSLLQTRPLGVMSVINPLRASGGADKESRDLARENVPLSVMPLDRLVSVADYADFTRGFAGIAKAIAQRVSDGHRQLIQLTIAGAADAPIDPSSDLHRNLLIALHALGDPDVPVQVDLRELTALVLSAGVKLLPDHRWDPVVAEIRARLLDAFGFGRRALGQPASRCEVLGVIQAVRGVAYVDIDAFGGVPEKVTAGGARAVRTPSEISDAVATILARGDRSARERVDAFPGGLHRGVIRPAQLVIFTPDVADTLILNQRS